LEFALAQEKREIVWELLRLGAKPRKQKNDNLLIDVPKFRDLELLHRLVGLGADVHGRDRAGQTPLLSAVAAGFYDAVHFLLDQGTDPTVRTKNGRSVFQLAESTRQFCRGLLPGSDGEVAELFRSQLADLDRIEELLETTLAPEQVSELSGKPSKEPEASTFWDLNDYVQLQLEISPFPFTSQSTSRLKGRLGKQAERWTEHFTDEGRVLFRVREKEAVGSWTPFALKGRDGRFLLFEGETQLPAGQATIEVRFDTNWEMFAGQLSGWEIKVK
jgi:hypothetical protein